MDIPEEKESYDDPYENFEKNEPRTYSPQGNKSNKLVTNFNPMTRTFFKCSIYSPSNRLYTVDEVNSNFSGD